MKLILRKTNKQAEIDGLILRDWGEDDYTILDGDTVVGRIYPQMIHGERRWIWNLQTTPAPSPKSGVADTLEEAKAVFKARYEQVIASRK